MDQPEASARPSGLPQGHGHSLLSHTPIRLLGSGTYGRVFLVHNDKKTKRAVKVILKTKSRPDLLKTERDILRLPRYSPFLMRSLDQSETETRVYLLLRFMPHGSLSIYQSQVSLTTDGIVRIAAGIYLGVQFLHDSKYVHRDLSANNVLIDGGGFPKISDFGLAIYMEKGYCTTGRYCTNFYEAPEMKNKKRYDRMVDWYAFGVVVLEMLFSQANMQLLVRNLIPPSDMYNPAALSAVEMSFCSGLMQPNPSNRLGRLKNAKDIKAHNFFKNVLWQNLWDSAESYDKHAHPRICKTDIVDYITLSKYADDLTVFDMTL